MKSNGNVILACFVLLSITQYVSARDLKIYFVDVNQGDAEYIELPNGKNALIDGGPSSSISSKLATFLTDNSVSNIDYVVLTHPHSDHYQGLSYVFDNCQVNNFYDTGMNNSGAAGDETVRSKATAESGCNISYPSEGDTLSWDPDVTVKILHATPGSASSSDGDTLNNSSIVLKLTYKGTSALFIGDIQDTVESQLVSTYGIQLAAKVLKVAHHGSQYSSIDAFLSKVSPVKAYIEVGASNSYGHPTAEALARLQNAGATIYRTDLNGTCTYTISSSTAIPEPDPGTGNPGIGQENPVKPAEFHINGGSGVRKKIKELKNRINQGN